jgi:hypothetical protein
MKNALLGTLLALTLTAGFADPSMAKQTKDCGPTMCKKCAKLCTDKLAYFKKKGGKYADAGRVQLMEDCIAVCKKREKDASAETAKACSAVCTKCATSCEELSDPKLKECIAMCKSCADMCAR